MKIITHGGNAHLDDFTACAMALVNWAWDFQEYAATEGQTVPLTASLDDACESVIIERRDPTSDELEDPEILVLDVGGVYDPARRDFDHHQLPRGTKESAMSLFAASIGLPNGGFNGTEQYEPGSDKYPADSLASFFEDAFPWFRTRVSVDACGPFATAKDVGVEWDTIAKFLGPLEDVILKTFENTTPKDRVYVVKPLAEMILRKHAAWEQVIPHVNYYRPWWSNNGFTVADFTAANPEETEACSDMITKYVTGVAIFHDNRGPGLTLLRLHDDPRIDFTKVKDDKEVAFAHAGGFVVKTKSKNVDEALRLIRSAYIDK